jgi:tetratricopeptide (TPR) repeat protein
LNADNPYAEVDRRLEAVHFYLGEIYLERGDLDRAKEELQAALAIEPTDADALYLLGNVLRQQEDYEGAVAVYALATNLVPDFREAYEGMADAAESQGDPLTASYARAMLRLFSDDVETAVRELENVVEQSPENAAAYFGLGYGYETLGQQDKAVAAYRRSLEADPSQYAAQSGLARLGSE